MIQQIAIPGGILGMAVTIEEMKKEAISGSFDFSIISFARNLLVQNSVNPRSNEEIANVVFWWIKENIRFVHDPYLAELIQSPAKTLQLRAGDCDDFAILFATLAMAVGVPIRFVSVGTETAEYYSHIYTEVEIEPSSWLAYDPSIPEAIPGWQIPPSVIKIKTIWPLEDGAQMGFIGLAFLISPLRKRLQKTFKSVARDILKARFWVLQETAKLIEKSDLGPWGRVLLVGLKGITLLSPGGWIYQIHENPWKLKDDEWRILIKLAATIASAILTVTTAGATSALLAATVLSLASTSITALELRENVEARKEALELLGAQKASFAIEARVQREAMRKMKYDIALLEFIKEQLNRYNQGLATFREENKTQLARLEGEIKQKYIALTEEYRQGKNKELNTIQSQAEVAAKQRHTPATNKYLEIKNDDANKHGALLKAQAELNLLAKELMRAL